MIELETEKMEDILVRNEEASGSIPLRSTMFSTTYKPLFCNHVPLRSNSVV